MPLRQRDAGLVAPLHRIVGRDAAIDLLSRKVRRIVS
jgi:hypothetical protein